MDVLGLQLKAETVTQVCEVNRVRIELIRDSRVLLRRLVILINATVIEDEPVGGRGVERI